MSIKIVMFSFPFAKSLVHNRDINFKIRQDRDLYPLAKSGTYVATVASNAIFPVSSCCSAAIVVNIFVNDATVKKVWSHHSIPVQ